MPRREPWEVTKRPTGNPAEDYERELYNLDEDFSQAHNPAAKHPRNSWK